MQLTHQRRTCARIRRGLYNYRGYNIRRYPHGWAVRGEDNEPFGPFAKRLRDIRGIIDLWSSPNRGDEPRLCREHQSI